MSDTPYKFLSPYDDNPEDREVFFGRERETEILLSDIVVRRLVVLFAKTGTGKTSLIKAGVMPRLVERGYNPYFIRVRTDPVVSARAAFEEKGITFSGRGNGNGQDTLASLLKELAAQVANPFVLFFDQFEEFFLYARKTPERRRLFISDVADFYKDKSSGVYIVFSMREDFLYEMDEFRSRIPDIFHKDSTLRLKGFSRSQARLAIKFPAAARAVKVENALVKRVLHDLSKSGETEIVQDEDELVSDTLSELDNPGGGEAGGGDDIDPTQLQIVCDTLWRKTVGQRGKLTLSAPLWRQYWQARRAGHRRITAANGEGYEVLTITLGDYLKLGRGGTQDNITRQILNQRFLEKFAELQSEAELNLLERLLPKLAHGRKTKVIRDVKSLAENLTVDETSLWALIDYLEAAGFVRVGRGRKLVELSHDYLVHSLEELRRRVRTIWPRRVLENAMGSDDAGYSFLKPEQLAKISERAEELQFDEAQLKFIFRSALTHGLHMRFWFERATRQHLEKALWEILENSLMAKR